jgi:hypothetical protein
MSDSNRMIAGWYRDPEGSAALRWWDGDGWTTLLRTTQPPAPAAGVGGWIMPSPGNAPGFGSPPPAIAAPAQQLAITATATLEPEAPMAGYGQPAPQPDYHYAQAPSQPVPYGQPAPHPDPFAQLLLAEPVPQGSASTTQPFVAGPTRSAQTVGIWLLALSPLLGVPIAMLAQAGAEYVLTLLDLPVPGIALIGAPVALVVAWIFAGADIGRLRKRGYRPPSILWMLLLPPLGYFIARSVALRRDRGKTWPAGIMLGISLAVLGAAIVVMISVVLALLASLGLLPPGLGLNA